MVTKFAEGAAEAGGSRPGGETVKRGLPFGVRQRLPANVTGKTGKWPAKKGRGGTGGGGGGGGALDNCALRLAVAVVLAVGTVGTVACLGGWRLLHSLYNYFKHSIGIRPQEATAGYVCARPQLYPFKCNNRHQARIRMGMAVQ